MKPLRFRLKLMKTLFEKKKIDIYVSVSRKSSRLLIEIDFGTEPVSSRTRVDGEEETAKERDKRERRNGQAKGHGRALRNGLDEDLRLSNFISVQLGAGLLGIEATMLFTPIPTDNC